jgi:hypothetical protein
MVKRLLSVCLLTGLLAGPAAPWVQGAQDEEEKSGGCVTFLLQCYGVAWEFDSWWQALAAVTVCDRMYLECVRLKVIGF